MKKNFGKGILAGILLLILPSVSAAEVRRIELDVAGYLCGR